MAEIVAFPDGETVWIQYLQAQWSARDEPADVASKIPNPRPDRFIRVSGTGGSRSNIATDNPGFLVECWDVTDTAAFDLARITRALMDATDGIDIGMWIEDIATSVPVLYPDPDTNLPRYQFTAQVHTLREVLA